MLTMITFSLCVSDMEKATFRYVCVAKYGSYIYCNQQYKKIPFSMYINSVAVAIEHPF